jgi:uncharacterized protein
MSGYLQPQYQSDQDHPRYRIRCPIHGFIQFSENERQIIDHRLFQRLRYVRQLALTEFLYPGASHTRYEHSLGVMEVATRAFDTLAAKHGVWMEAKFREVEGYESETMAKARQHLRIAALLHDVGHASFSHSAEGIVNSGKKHEVLSEQIIREEAFLGSILTQLFGPECVNRASQIIKGDIPTQLRVLKNLVSGEMDADRTDYLIRDSHHCGVDYGRFDYRRMILCLDLSEDPSGALEVALHTDGIHTFEALILARYQMNTQVYFHRLRRIYDQYLVRYHQALGQDLPDTPEKVLAHNDITMFNMIWKDAENNTGERQKWAYHIANRIHHRVVHETGVNAHPNDLRCSEQVLIEMTRRYASNEFIRDVAAGPIHKLLTRNDESEDGLVRLALVGRDNRPRWVGFESQVLGKIPHKFQCARIFASISREQYDLRREMQKAASDIFTERGGN